MHMFLVIFAVVLLSTNFILVQSAVKTTNNPIRLELFQRKRAHGNSTVRTNPSFFQNVLELNTGESFKININKWNALKRSDLFANLSAKSFITSDEKAGLTVKGTELESRTIRPEISISTNRDKRPEIVCGIVSKDRHFRGLGEIVELMAYYKAEHVNSGFSTLLPSLRLKWQDCAIGKSSRVSAEVSQLHAFECNQNLSPVLRRSHLSKANCFAQIPISITQCSVNLEGVHARSEINAHVFPSWLSSIQYGIRPFRTAFTTPSTHSVVGDEATDNELGTRSSGGGVRQLTGVKSVVNIAGQAGAAVRVWHERGTSADNQAHSADPFHQLGCRVDLPTLRLPLSIRLPRIGLLVRRQSSQSTEERLDVGHRCSLLGTLKLNAVRSWGAGCVPLRHHQALSSDSAPSLRGVPLGPDPAEKAYRSVSSILAAQADLCLDTQSGLGAVGVFADWGAYQVDRAAPAVTLGPLEAWARSTTVGLTLRTLGLRLDVGSPVDCFAPRLHMCFDQQN